MPRDEIVHFILPVRLETRWLPLRIKLTARYGSEDKTVRAQKEISFRDLRAGDDVELYFSVAARHSGKLILDEARIEVRTFFGLFKFRKLFRHRDRPMMTYVLPLPNKTDDTLIRAFNKLRRAISQSVALKKEAMRSTHCARTAKEMKSGGSIGRSAHA